MVAYYTKEDTRMYDIKLCISYSIAVFTIVMISGCILNLLKHHFIYQLAGIAFFFTYSILNSVNILQKNHDAGIKDLYLASLPVFSGISACLICMVLGYWIFPPLRRKFKA